MGAIPNSRKYKDVHVCKTLNNIGNIRLSCPFYVVEDDIDKKYSFGYNKKENTERVIGERLPFVGIRS